MINNRVWLIRLVLLVLILALVTQACVQQPQIDVGKMLGEQLAKKTNATLALITDDVKKIDTVLDIAHTRLNKLNQAVEPALKWIDLQKARGEKEGWGGVQDVQVTDDLAQLKNDLFQVTKLQLIAERQPSGLKFDSVILVRELSGGQVSPYLDMKEDIQRQISALMNQREAAQKKWQLVRSAAVTVLEQAPTWKIARVNAITYQVTGPSLGWDNGVIAGEWLYYTDTEKAIPSTNPSMALDNLFSGK